MLFNLILGFKNNTLVLRAQTMVDLRVRVSTDAGELLAPQYYLSYGCCRLHNLDWCKIYILCMKCRLDIALSLNIFSHHFY